ncbi:MAG: T3SS effector HopA1 family protein [Spirosomaceae bacterium]|nr:T3SS effector HopA1 family protein [Spirosomataceae bacterium]
MNTSQQIDFVIGKLDESFKERIIEAVRYSDSKELFMIETEVKKQVYLIYSNISTDVDETEADEFLQEEKLKKLIKKLGGKSVVWDKNWSLVDTNQNYSKIYGQFLVFKAGEYRLVEPGGFVFDAETEDLPKNGKYVNIRIKKAEILTSDGGNWFFVRGNHFIGLTSLVRVYINFRYDFDRILNFIEKLDSELNRRFIPYNLKLTTQSSTRFDSTVIYFQKEHYYIVFLVLNKLIRKYSDILQDGIPFFTKQVGLKGVGFAEDPMKIGDSFGMNRARLISKIYVDYFREKCHFDCFSFVKKELTNKGFCVNEFFRNPNTNFPYDFEILTKEFEFSVGKVFNFDKYFTKIPLMIAYIICKQAIVISKNGKSSCHWMEAQKTYNFTNLLYKKVKSEDKLRILIFFNKLLKIYSSDWILAHFTNIITEDLLKTAPTLLNDNAYVDSDDNFELDDDVLRNFLKEIKFRGVSTELHDDSFSPIEYLRVANTLMSRNLIGQELNLNYWLSLKRYFSSYFNLT